MSCFPFPTLGDREREQDKGEGTNSRRQSEIQGYMVIMRTKGKEKETIKKSSSLALHHRVIHIAPATSGSHPAQLNFRSESAEEVVEAITSATGSWVVTVYIWAKPNCVELKQFVSLTMGIRGSPGSAKTMSTHCFFVSRMHHTDVVSSCFHRKAYRVQRCAVLSQFNDLNRRPIAGRHVCAHRQRDLRQADSSRERIVRGAEKHKRLDHDVGHVGRTAIGAVSAVSEVDLELSLHMAAEPAWLEGDGAAGCWPVCAVSGCSHATACCWLALSG